MHRGIILAGGTGSRLHPITKVVSKQLLPVYDKPMIYYPLTTLMMAGIRDILIITKPEDKESFQKLLGDGSNFGINIFYEIQSNPEGLAQAFIIGENFLNGHACCLILGDNLFYGDDFASKLKKSNSEKDFATLYAYRVNDPKRYGVVEFNSNGDVTGIEEKPENPKSNYAITGIYFYDESVVEMAKSVTKSDRGELEITELNNFYLQAKKLKVIKMGRGTAWFDTGTYDSLLEASSFIRTLSKRQALKVGCPEEIAWRQGWINNEQLINNAKPLLTSEYGKYLIDLIQFSK